MLCKHRSEHNSDVAKAMKDAMMGAWYHKGAAISVYVGDSQMETRWLAETTNPVSNFIVYFQTQGWKYLMYDLDLTPSSPGQTQHVHNVYVLDIIPVVTM